MSFWAYMLHCKGGYFYVGHTDNLEARIPQHQSGHIRGFTRDHLPVELVWSQEFASRYEALAAERQIIRGDWAQIIALAKAKTGLRQAQPERVWECRQTEAFIAG